MRFRLIFSIIGFMTVIGGLVMLLPAAVDWFWDFHQSAAVFALTSALTVAVGTILLLLTDVHHVPLRTKEMFIVTTLVWAAFVLFSALPFCFLGLNMSFVDALFEATSGLTTTGATVIADLSRLSPGTLFWRSLMHWMGGIGILVVAILILPTLQIGGMQLFNIEMSGESDRDMPTMSKNILGIFIFFVFLTLLAVISLYAGGMDWFDAVNHAMSVVATGGFSTHNESIAYFNSPVIDWILIFFMFIGGLPLAIGWLLITRNFSAIRDNEQIKNFCFLCIGLVLFIAAVRWHQAAFDNHALSEVLRSTAFSVVSIVSTTGFVTVNYESWGSYATMIFFFLLLSGACTGSTSGGIKIFRYTILFKTIRAKLKSAARPNGVFIPRYGNKPVTEDIVTGVLVFMGLYAVCASVGAVLLSLFGLDLITSLSGAVSSLSNMGPALGKLIGPDQTFALLPEGAKLVMTLLMIIGRLEFVAVFVLLVPFFWKRNI